MAIVVELEALLISAGLYAFPGDCRCCPGRGRALNDPGGASQPLIAETILARDHARFDGRRLRRSFKRFLWEYQPAGVPLDHYQGTFSLPPLLPLSATDAPARL